MNKLHIYNPGYEAEFYTEGKWTPRKNVAQLRRDLAELPFYICDDGDEVYLGEESYRPLPKGKELAPWGWSPELIRLFGPEAVPFSHNDMRYIASRERSVQLVQMMCERYPECYDSYLNPSPLTYEWINEAEGLWVVKEEFSSSGRGVQFIRDMAHERAKWVEISKTSKKHFFVEPFFERLEDRGYEFFRNEEHQVSYVGPSSFATSVDGRYLGNRLLVPERLETQWRDANTFPRHDEYVAQLLQLFPEFFTGHLANYVGYFGVDTIVYREGERLRIHPCIEINIRPTMGVVALLLGKRYLTDEQEGVMELKFFPSHEQLQQELADVDPMPLYRHEHKNLPLVSGTHLLTSLRDSTQFVATLTIR